MVSIILWLELCARQTHKGHVLYAGCLEHCSIVYCSHLPTQSSRRSPSFTGTYCTRKAAQFSCLAHKNTISQGLNISQNLYLIELISHGLISHSYISRTYISPLYLTAISHNFISQLACSISQLFISHRYISKCYISACLSNISRSLETWQCPHSS